MEQMVMKERKERKDGLVWWEIEVVMVHQVQRKVEKVNVELKELRELE